MSRLPAVAIVGAGIAGLACARALAGRAEVTVLEAAPRPGGHVYTTLAPGARGPVAVDLGFIVFSRPTYPRFTALLDELGIGSRPTTMSFSVVIPDQVGDQLEWSSASPRGWFAQPRNLARASHWRFLAAVMQLLAAGRRDVGSELARRATLAEYLAARGAPADVRDGFAIPLAAALWSLAPDRCGAFPAETWLRFLDQHGMLRAHRPHPWRTVVGGSRAYVDALVARLVAHGVRVETSAAVTRVHRDGAGVSVIVGDAMHRFDRVVLATHADTALALLADPTDDERATLGAFGYSTNRTVLHDDVGFLPRARAAWAAWNYVAEPDRSRVDVTYWMNALSVLPDDRPYLVTLNPRRPPAGPGGTLHAVDLTHPQLDFAALAAQAALPSLQGVRRTYVAGAYAGFGFHEDGLRAGVHAAARVLADEAR